MSQEQVDSRRQWKVSDLHSLHVLVVGAGVTGRALQRFCEGHGAHVSLLDDRVDGALREIPTGVELALISPGWRPDHPAIQAIINQRIPVLSEIDFAWEMKSELAPDQRWLSLSGTNGKTTTIQMLESIFKNSEIKGVACGNVGRTVIESISPQYDFLAIELSSFQIHWSDKVRFESIALLNISPDHIDWHGSFDAYRDAKLKLISLSKSAFINVSDATLSRAWPTLERDFDAKVIPFHLGSPASGEIGLVEDLIVDRALVVDAMNAEVLVELGSLPSRAPHNVSNAMAAAALAKSIGVPTEAIASGLQKFAFDHHRLEEVGNFDGVVWIDDSKATNPHAAMAALFAYDSVIWIAGGLAKGASMEELVRATSARIRAAILIGTDAPLIRSALEAVAPNLKIVDVLPSSESDIEGHSVGEDVMRRAVIFAKNLASRGDTVLLAPACASMDQFVSYAHRGDIFKTAVLEVAGNVNRNESGEG
jgi:UDP-N-acetylmuramoylalanine--D-glutamate ligase